MYVHACKSVARMRRIAEEAYVVLARVYKKFPYLLENFPSFTGDLHTSNADLVITSISSFDTLISIKNSPETHNLLEWSFFSKLDISYKVWSLIRGAQY